MRRASALVMCATLLAACAEDRHVRVIVETGASVAEEIHSIAAHAQITAAGGVVAQRDETLPAGDHARPISFPADLVVLIGDASGTLLVTVAGRRGDDGLVASGFATATIPKGGSGEVATVHVVLERGGPGGGVCGDGIASIGEICYGPALAWTTATPGGPAAADVDGDGLADLVAAVGGTDPGRGLTVSRARGSDVFEPPRAVDGPAIDWAGSADLALGDVDGDGRVDAVVASREGIAPLLALGVGEEPWFGHIAPIATTGDEPGGRSPVLADLDQDGDLDVVAVGHDSVWIAMGRGDGTFEGSSVAGILGSWRAVPGELDGDPGLEIAVAESDGVLRVIDLDGATVVEGSVGGSGAFRALTVVDVDASPPSEIVAGVGPELRILHVDAGTLVLDLASNLGPGRPLELAPARELDGAPAVLALVDEQTDAEGYLPAVVWLGRGPGRTLAPAGRSRVMCRNGRLGAADMDGDGQSEALLGCDGSAIVVQHRVEGQLEVPQKGPDTSGSAVGDIDGDGRPDVVRHWWSLGLVRRADDPNAVNSIEEVPGSEGEELGATFGYFAGDERDDLVSACTERGTCGDNGSIKRWTANVGGAVEAMPPIPLPALATSVTLARTVVDAKLRIVTTLEDGRLQSLDGETGATESEAVGAPLAVWRSAAGPVDATPGDDVLVVGQAGEIVLFRNDGDGRLGDGTQVDTAQQPTGLAVGDGDGDGVAEIVLTQADTTNVQVIRVGESGVENAGSFAAGIRPRAASLLDLDGDGIGELVLGGDRAIEVWSLAGAEGPVLRYAMAGLETCDWSFFAFSVRASAGGGWLPPMLFGVGRWDIEGGASYQEYVMSWSPRP